MKSPMSGHSWKVLTIKKENTKRNMESNSKICKTNVKTRTRMSTLKVLKNVYCLIKSLLCKSLSYLFILNFAAPHIIIFMCSIDMT